MNVTVVLVNNGVIDRDDLTPLDYTNMLAMRARGWTDQQIIDHFVGEINPPVRIMQWTGVYDGRPFEEVLAYPERQSRR